MSKEPNRDNLDRDVREVLEHLRGNLKPVANTEEWEQLVDAGDRSPDEKEKLKALGRFLTLKQYFEEQGELLEPVLVEGFLQLHRFSLPLQITWLNNVNRKLMEKLDARPRA